MKFTFPNNDKLVDEIMTDLVSQFERNWKKEEERQRNMAVRARELLLRWGSFSEDYVERAELLCDVDRNDGKRKSWIVLAIFVAFVAPMIGTLPFVITIRGKWG